jgi:triosephosphate isomerase (TIM)
MNSNRPLVAGNWKMNGLQINGLALVRDLMRALADDGPARSDLLICPPAQLLFAVAEAIGGAPIAIGGQDCHTEPFGAHTGDISAPMLNDAGCTYVIVGHSERRAEHGESDARVCAKAHAAHETGLTAIICVGENGQQRDAGAALEIVQRQLEGSLPPQSAARNTVIAYEPVWAIGSGRTPTAAQIAEMHGHIRGILAARIDDAAALRLLYGGSVKADNAAEILAIDNVDGALVGGASLNARNFWAIGQSAP